MTAPAQSGPRRHAMSLRDSVFRPVWLDCADRPAARPGLGRDLDADLLVVGGGFTGLWTALRAIEREPTLRVLLVEGDRIAEHATGRNGGFCEASLTHGEANGRQRWPQEYDRLQALGTANLDAIEKTLVRYGIDCGFVRGGVLNVATRPHEVQGLEPDRAGFLDAAAVREIVDSPTYLAGRHHRDDCALVDPARLAWGLAEAAESQGVQIHEHSRLTSLHDRADHVEAVIDAAVPDVSHVVTHVVRAHHVVLATNVFPGPIRRVRHSLVPVYDYVLATEPLNAVQLASLRWDPSIGVADSGNQFHYSRITPDRRILWGGYDAVYHYGRSIDPRHEDRRETFETLAEHFFDTFPQLEEVRFTHRWSGVIDTCTRFCAFYGTTHRRRTVYAAGFTGLGVGASRFAADVMLDLLTGEDTERTRLQMVRTRPLPFPPEPFTWIGVQATRWALARADSTGRRNLWLRALDRAGLGFDS